MADSGRRCLKLTNEQEWDLIMSHVIADKTTPQMSVFRSHIKPSKLVFWCWRRFIFDKYYLMHLHRTIQRKQEALYRYHQKLRATHPQLVEEYQINFAALLQQEQHTALCQPHKHPQEIVREGAQVLRFYDQVLKSAYYIERIMPHLAIHQKIKGVKSLLNQFQILSIKVLMLQKRQFQQKTELQREVEAVQLCKQQIQPMEIVHNQNQQELKKEKMKKKEKSNPSQKQQDTLCSQLIQQPEDANSSQAADIERQSETKAVSIHSASKKDQSQGHSQPQEDQIIQTTGDMSRPSQNPASAGGPNENNGTPKTARRNLDG